MFYITLFLLNKYLRKNIMLGIVVYIFAVLIFYSLRYFPFYKLYCDLIIKEPYIFDVYQFVLSGLWWWVHYTIYAGFYFYFINTRNTKQKQYELEKHNIQLNNEKILADFNYLKAQINPHFLYNTLSYFVGKTQQYDENLANGLGKLSGIMQYSLQKVPLNGKVSLVSELESMDSYIELHKLRYGNTLNMHYTKTGTMEGYSIIPHILITVVENAFKHGNTRSETQALDINVKVMNDTLYFTVVNAIDKVGLQRSGTYMGVDNMRKRLDLYYKEAHTMQIKETEDIYSTHITIPLK
jgi:two-component system, LytTR family, sensor kinase